MVTVAFPILTVGNSSDTNKPLGISVILNSVREVIVPSSFSFSFVGNFVVIVNSTFCPLCTKESLAVLSLTYSSSLAVTSAS